MDGGLFQPPSRDQTVAIMVNSSISKPPRNPRLSSEETSCFYQADSTPVASMHSTNSDSFPVNAAGADLPSATQQRPAPSKRRLPILTLGLSLGFAGLGLSQQVPVAAEASTLEDTTAANAGDSSQQIGLSVDPIREDAAGLDAGGAGEAAAASMEELSDGILPEAFLLKAALGGISTENLFLSENNPVSDLTFVELLGLGYQSAPGKNSGFALDYTATASQYLDHPELDGINHTASAKGNLKLNQTSLSLFLDFEQLATASQRQFLNAGSVGLNQRSTTDLQSIQFANRQSFSGGLTASRDLAPKTIFTGSLNYYGSFYDETRFRSSQTFLTQAGLGYRITGKTILGLAGNYGYLNTKDVPEEKFQNALLTVNYDATGKLVLAAQTGVRFRQYENSSGSRTEQPDSTKFVFNLQGTYQLRPKTAFQIFAATDSSGSALSGAGIETTMAGARLRQGIGDKLSLELTGGLENNSYEQPVNRLSSDRVDNYWSNAIRLIYQPNAKTSLGVYYNYLQNDSPQPGASYETNRFGVQAAMSF